jgi:hypothetical protein
MILKIVIIVVFVPALLGSLLFVAHVPIHELGHVIVAKIVGAEIWEVSWFSLFPKTSSFGYTSPSFSGYVMAVIPEGGEFIMDIAGGLFQGIVYLLLGSVPLLLLKARKISPPVLDTDIRLTNTHVLVWIYSLVLSTQLLLFGAMGIWSGFAEAGVV